MAFDIDVFWSFRSPYSYLVTPRLLSLDRIDGVRVHLRPVYPIAVRKKGFFGAQDPLWIDYLLSDVSRTADFLGMTIRWPRPDPVVVDPGTMDAVDEQPYIHRLTRLGVLAVEAGCGLAFINEVSRLIWDGRVTNWDTGDHLTNAASRAGLDLATLDEAAIREEARLENTIAQNQSDQRERGHWGVPLMVFRGEPFFGQDRFDQLLWRLRQNGLDLAGLE